MKIITQVIVSDPQEDSGLKKRMAAFCFIDGTIEIYNYPCLSADAKPVVIKAHFGPIGGIGWSGCGRYLISAGWFDLTVSIWDLLHK